MGGRGHRLRQVDYWFLRTSVKVKTVAMAVVRELDVTIIKPRIKSCSNALFDGLFNIVTMKLVSEIPSDSALASSSEVILRMACSLLLCEFAVDTK